MTKRIALLYGGASSEHDVSVMGYEYVSELLRDTEYEIVPVYISKSGGWSVMNDGVPIAAYLTAKGGGSLNTEYGLIKIDAAIPLLHGDGGEDGSVQGALECARIPYVGADVSTSALCLDKAYSKAVADSLGIPTVKSVSPRRYESVSSALEKCKRELCLPLFIKPRRLGSSLGAGSAASEEEFLKVYEAASQIGDGLVIVEERLTEKRELECAFAQINGKKIVTPPGEILIGGFYGYGEKYGGKTKTEPLAKVDVTVRETVMKYSAMLAEAMMLRHLSRIDFFLAKDKIFFNEINTFPGFTKESLYPKMLAECGIDPRDALISFVKDALCS